MLDGLQLVVTCVSGARANLRRRAAATSFDGIAAGTGCRRVPQGLDRHRHGAPITAHFGATIEDLVQLVEDQIGRPEVVAIDIPIGLPDATVRDADRLARTMIGPRRIC